MIHVLPYNANEPWLLRFVSFVTFQVGATYADMDEYVKRLDRDRIRLITKLKVRKVFVYRTHSISNRLGISNRVYFVKSCAKHHQALRVTLPCRTYTPAQKKK